MILTLGIDASQYKKGQTEAAASLKKTRESASTAAKEMEADGKKAAQFFSAIKVEALSLIGVLVGGKGLAAFTADATRSMAELGRAAANINISVRGLSAFQNVIERNGGSATAATASLKGYADAVERFKVLGDASILQYLNPIGADINDPVTKVIEKFQKYIEEHIGKPGGAQLINLIGKGLGFDQGMINAMIQIRTLKEEQRQLNAEMNRAITPKMADDSRKLQSAWADLEHQATFLGETILTDLSPQLQAVLKWGTDEIAQHPEVAKAITETATAIGILGGLRISANLMGLTGLASVFGGILASVDGILVAAGLSELVYRATRIETLNDGEQKYLDDWRKAHGLPPGPQGLYRTNDPAGPASAAPLPADVEAEVRRQAALHGLDAEHMVRLARQEHGGYDNVSPVGAFGPMQLMPDTAASVGVTKGGPWQDNVRGGMDYYRRLLRQFNGNYPAADAAYNAGPNNPGVRRFFETGDPSGLPDETRNYVNSINGTPNGVPRPGPIAGPQLGAAHPPTPASKSDSKLVQMHIGAVTVHTQSTDPNGIARDLHGELLVQANRGLQ